MINISASLIKDYLWCKRKGYYRINHPEQAIKTDEMIIGEVVHKVIETHWNKDKDQAKAEAHRLLSTYNLTDPNLNKMKKLSRSMDNFFNHFSYLLNNDDIVEKFFKVPFSDGVMMSGKMDRITKDGIIIDWKVTRFVPKTIDNDIQFIIYYMSHKQLYGDYPKKLFYIALENAVMVEFTPKDYYIKFLYGDVIPNIVDDIRNGRFERTGFYNNSCLNCPFQLTCWSEL